MEKNLKFSMSRPAVQSSAVHITYVCLAVLIVVTHHSFLEELESGISAFIAHEYAPLSDDYALLDANFLIMPLMSYVNSFFKGFQLYGYFVFIVTFISGLVLLDVLKKVSVAFRKSFLPIGLVFILFQLPNLISLSITRATFFLGVSLLVSFHLKIYSKRYHVIIYLLGIVFRLDMMVILCIGYLIADIIISRRVKLRTTLLAASAVFTFAAYNTLISNYASEPFKAFYYYELDFVDRDNIDYVRLNESQRLIVEMGKNGVIDENLFSQNFIESILYLKSSFLTNVLLSPELFLNVFRHSLDALEKSRWLILFCFLLLMMQFIRKKKANRLLFTFLFLFPLLICFYISLPNRFVFPYYSFLSIFLIFSSERKSQVAGLVCITFIVAQYCLSTLSSYRQMVTQFDITMQQTEQLEKTHGLPLIFENAFYSRFVFMNPNIAYRYTGNDYLFLNIAFFQAFDNYQASWRKYDCKNPLSIKDKVVTAQALGKPILFFSEERHQSYLQYLSKRYDYVHHFNYVVLE